VHLALHDPALATVPTERKLSLALELEAAARAIDRRVTGVEAADYADSESVAAIASTTGVRRSGMESSTYLGADVLASDGAGTSTGFGFSVGRGPGALDPELAARDAVERAVRMLGATKAPSEHLTVVFDPYVTSQFLGLVAELLSGEAVLKGRTPFAHRVGERVAAPVVTLLDDAVDPSALSASEVDGEGLACRPVTLVDDGVLAGFLHNAYSARACSTVPTGSARRSSPRTAPGVGPHVVKIGPGTDGPEELLRRVGDGLLVRELSGLHSGVNPVSGDLSVGVEAQRIRGGEVAEPVREVTIASTLQRMLLQVVAVGADLTYFPWEATGVTLAIDDVAMSGT
jgi:PmbA protein